VKWLVVGCLVAAAVVACWPRRDRRRRVIDRQRPTARNPRRPWAFVRSLPAGRVALVAVMGAGLVGVVLAGPVAGLMTGAYGGLAARGALRRRASQAAARMRTRSLDALCALAADLRAGLPAGALDGPESIEDHRMAELTRAAWRLAERTGAPIAELIERIEADARAMDRGSAAAAAQAAGARATAWLLAGLPAGGIALGYGIGVDPLDVLLHTPIGAGCAIGAIALQIAGLAWADRLAAAGVADRLAAAGVADRLTAAGVADWHMDPSTAARLPAVRATDRPAPAGGADWRVESRTGDVAVPRTVAAYAAGRGSAAASLARRPGVAGRAPRAEVDGRNAALTHRAVGRAVAGVPDRRSVT
jgi:tight adherence protein B